MFHRRLRLAIKILPIEKILQEYCILSILTDGVYLTSSWFCSQLPWHKW
jgi:hypothetical protein